MKDLIIGGATNYTWNQVKYWINSIKRSGFEGDIVLVMSNVNRETIEKLSRENVKLLPYGVLKSDGGFQTIKNEVSHVDRFFYIWNYLSTTTEKYRYVITTDTRDVIFQKNPSDWIEKNIGNYKLVCSSEGLRYKNEPWGNQNIYDAFDRNINIYNKLKDEIIYNVGVIGGHFSYVTDLMLMLHQTSINRKIPIVDQAVFNFLLNLEPYKSVTFKTTHEHAWAVQLGTSPDAIKSGSGDIGLICKINPLEYEKYTNNYLESSPKFLNGVFYNHNDIPFTIVHQYDRINDIRNYMEKKYE